MKRPTAATPGKQVAAKAPAGSGNAKGTAGTPSAAKTPPTKASAKTPATKPAAAKATAGKSAAGKSAAGTSTAGTTPSTAARPATARPATTKSATSTTPSAPRPPRPPRPPAKKPSAPAAPEAVAAPAPVGTAVEALAAPEAEVAVSTAPEGAATETTDAAPTAEETALDPSPAQESTVAEPVEPSSDAATAPPRRGFRAPWWSGNRAAAAASVDAEPVAVVTPAPPTPASDAGPAPAPRPAPAPPTRVDSWFAAHGSALLWLVPVMIVAATVTAFGIPAPARSVEEALFTGYVYDVLTNGGVAPFTVWAQHPPLGWMQMAAYVQLTGAFGRWDLAVLAVREATVPFAALTAAGVWLLGRRVGLSRLAAAIAAVVASLSPFALAQHTAVSLENVATPWLLLAFVLATARRHRSPAFALSGVLFAVAVMSAETAVVALPFLVWTMVRATRPGSRVWPIASAVVALQVVAGLYLLVASQQPAAVSPISPVFAAFGANPTAATWWASDPLLLILLVVGAAAGIAVPTLRPLAAFVLTGLAIVLVSGIRTPDGVPALIVPVGVVVLVGAAAHAFTTVRERGPRRSAVPVAVIAVVALGAVAAILLATTRLPAALSGRAVDPAARAEAWMLENLDRSDPVLVDSVARVDFLRAGWARDDVAAYSVGGGTLPATWTDAEWAIVPASAGDLAEADSLVVASFDHLEVRRVLPGGVEAAEADEAERAAVRTSLGAEVVQNPDLRVADADADLLAAGAVDDRIVSVLGALTVFGPLDVAGFPVVEGEDPAVRREVALAAADGNPLVAGGELTAAGRDVVDGLLDRYEPEEATVDGGLLVLRYSLTLGEPAE